MRRTIIPTVCFVLLLTAAVASAGEIPNRPEQLEFPDLIFDVPDADALRFELTDGTPVYAKRDTQFPLVSITVFFRGGRYLEPAGKEGLAAITSEAWRAGGAGERTAQELDEELDFLAAAPPAPPYLHSDKRSGPWTHLYRPPSTHHPLDFESSRRI
jgi:hypothetical protein